MHVVTLHLSGSGHLEWRILSEESCLGGSANSILHFEEFRTPRLDASKHSFVIPQLDEATQLANVALIPDLAKAPLKSGPSLPLLSQDPELTF
jgi:hypothetical protein